MTEKYLYQFLEHFIKSNFKCFAVFQKKGPIDVGYADVLGLRDIGGQASGDIEVIAVEVKLYDNNFGKLLGQTLGYSLFAHKCYLAIPFSGKEEGFTLEQKEMANKLGVGLIAIRRKSKKCFEVLTSNQHNPIKALTLKTLEKIGYDRCSVCGSVFGPAKSGTRISQRASDTKHYYYWNKKECKNRKMLFTKSGPGRARRYSTICVDCLEAEKKRESANGNAG